MLLSISTPDSKEPISSLEFNDNAIVEVVTFWANIKYQSPQFPLDLNPNVNQLSTLYKDGAVPNIELDQDTTFEVACDDERIKGLKIVQLKMNFIGQSNAIPTKKVWNDCFENTNSKWTYVPDGSAYIAPVGEPLNAITLHAVDDQPTPPKYLSYEVLVAFEIEEKTYYANFDPFAKVTNHGGG